MTLDTLVATAGMGWPVIDTHTPLREAKPHGGFVLDGRPEVFDVQGLRTEIFHPSTNIAHAHMFRDKVLAENPWTVECDSWASEEDGKMFHMVCITHRSTDEVIATAEMHRAEPLALCLALLRALGVPEEKIKEAMDGK